tara:strand:+ start:167 stop:337 length:171 start_codon:yes stop_codon:yes gene_type:complete
MKTRKQIEARIAEVESALIEMGCTRPFIHSEEAQHHPAITYLAELLTLKWTLDELP